MPSTCSSCLGSGTTANRPYPVEAFLIILVPPLQDGSRPDCEAYYPFSDPLYACLNIDRCDCPPAPYATRRGSIECVGAGGRFDGRGSGQIRRQDSQTKRSGRGTRCEHIPYLGRCRATQSSLQTVSGMNVSSPKRTISRWSRQAAVLRPSTRRAPLSRTRRSPNSRSPGVMRSSVCSRSTRGTGLSAARSTYSSGCPKNAARCDRAVGDRPRKRGRATVPSRAAARGRRVHGPPAPPCARRLTFATFRAKAAVFQ